MELYSIFNLINMVLFGLFIGFSVRNLEEWIYRCLQEKSVLSITRPILTVAYKISLMLVPIEFLTFTFILKEKHDIWIRFVSTSCMYLFVGYLCGVWYLLLMSHYKDQIKIRDYNKQEAKLFFKALIQWPLIMNKTVGQVIRTI